jgi:hypothetical protein
MTRTSVVPVAILPALAFAQAGSDAVRDSASLTSLWVFVSVILLAALLAILFGGGTRIGTRARAVVLPTRRHKNPS